MKSFIRLVFLASLIVAVTSQYPRCSTLLDIGMLLDASGSIGIADYNRAKDAVVSLVNNFNIAQGKIYFGMINFSTTPTLIQGFIPTEQEKQSVITKIKAMPYIAGSTGTVAALKLARDRLFNQVRSGNPPRIAIILTDGYSTDGGLLKVKEEAAGLKKMGVEVFSIGVGSLKRDELEAMASYPENVVVLANYQAVASSINMITQKICETNGFFGFGRTISVNTEEENRYYVTEIENELNPDLELVEISVVEKKGIVQIFGSSKIKNPNDSNSRALVPVRSVVLKNGWRKDTYWYMVDKGDKDFFSNIQGLRNANDADVKIDKISFAKAIQQQIEFSFNK